MNNLSEKEREILCSPKSKRKFDRRTVLDFAKTSEGESGFFLVIAGEVRYILGNDEGQRICCYRVKQGGFSYPEIKIELAKSIYIERVAEKGSELWFYSPDQEKHIFSISENTIAYYLLEECRECINELISFIGELSFSQLKDRLFRYLCINADKKNHNTVLVTHEVLANDLGSTREVISRLLKQMEKNGDILLERGKITLLKMQLRMRN